MERSSRKLPVKSVAMAGDGREEGKKQLARPVRVFKKNVYDESKQSSKSVSR